MWASTAQCPSGAGYFWLPYMVLCNIKSTSTMAGAAGVIRHTKKGTSIGSQANTVSLDMNEPSSSQV